MDREIVGYVVSGPTGTYDYECETLEEAFEAYDLETEDGDDGWVIGVKHADGSVSFDCMLRRAA